MSQLQDYDFRSEEVKEILGTPPSWLLRYGTTLIISGMFVIGFLFYSIKFPDKITGEIILNTTGDIVEVQMPISDYLNDVFVTDSMKVYKNQPIATRRNDLSYANYWDLKDEIDSLQNVSKSQANYIYPKQNLALGPFKRQYEGLLNSLDKFQQSVQSDDIKEQLGRLRSDKTRRAEEIKRAIKERTKVEERKIELEKRKKQLLKRHKNKESTTSELYAIQDKIKDTEVQLDRIDNSISKLKEDIYYTNQRISKEANNKQEGNIAYWDSFQERLQDFSHDIRTWEDEYLITAPIEGHVILYHKDWKDKLFERSKPIVGIIRPNTINEDDDGYISSVNVGLEGYGNIAEGQDVILKFDSYPFKQFGVVKGEVINKGRLVQGKNRAIEVRVPKQLETTFGKNLEKEPKMYGTAEILTEDRRFLARIFEQFRSIFKNN